MAEMLLAVDVGGTKCELALFPARGDDYQPIARKRFPSEQYGRLEDIIASYLQETSAEPSFASIGVAGVVSGGRGEVTNLPWVIDKDVIRAEFGFERVEMINDLTSVCASLSLLGPEDVMEIQAGEQRVGEVIGVVAPGTGLGEGYLVHREGLFYPRGCEGGHADFAPTDELQGELLTWMRNRENPVSFESLIAGPGVPNIYDFFHLCKGQQQSDHVREELTAADDRTPVIFNNAFGDRACPLCRRVVDLFLEILGSEAGNLALKLYARGGIYLGGGILPRIADQASFSGFLKAFRDKGKMAELMPSFSIRLILRKDAALIGVARYGREMLGR